MQVAWVRKEELLSVYTDLGNMEYGDGLETFLSVTESDQSVWSLVIPTVQLTHHGFYQCQVSGSGGSCPVTFRNNFIIYFFAVYL